MITLSTNGDAERTHHQTVLEIENSVCVITFLQFKAFL